MKITKHAYKRMSQRTINEIQVILISLFGTTINKDKEFEKLSILDKEIYKIREQLDKCKGKVIVVDKSFKNLVTAYSLYR